MTAFGFLNIDKPYGVTSHDGVSIVKRLLRRQGDLARVGHAGTLDPLATGVLVVCVGAATRLAEYAMHTEKRYRATVRLGVVTETYDAEGAIVREADASWVTAAHIEGALHAFRGTIAQVPPMYSAIKQGGRKLYEIARAGETVERAPRTVSIHVLTLAEWNPPLAVLDVTCSAGTYIRSLAYDLGEALGVGGSLAGLVRTASGAFRVEDAMNFEQIGTDPVPHLIPPDRALAHMPRVVFSAQSVDAVEHGRAALMHEPAAPGTLAIAYNERGALVAVVRAVGELWQPEKVFPA